MPYVQGSRKHVAKLGYELSLSTPRTSDLNSLQLCMCIYIYVHMCIFVCVCACVCVKYYSSFILTEVLIYLSPFGCLT